MNYKNLKQKKMKTIIRTSEVNWFEKSMKCYKEKISFTFIDDANLGITETNLKSGFDLIRSRKMPWESIVGVLAGIGITRVGIYIIGLAIADPEPTTKLGLLISGGLLLALTGSIGILYSLGVNFSVSASSTYGGFTVKNV